MWHYFIYLRPPILPNPLPSYIISSCFYYVGQCRHCGVSFYRSGCTCSTQRFRSVSYDKVPPFLASLLKFFLFCSCKIDVFYPFISLHHPPPLTIFTTTDESNNFTEAEDPFFEHGHGGRDGAADRKPQWLEVHSAFDCALPIETVIESSCFIV